MKYVFSILFGAIIGACAGTINLPLIPKILCAFFLGIPAAVLGIALTNHLEKGVKSKNALRQMQYDRLRRVSRNITIYFESGFITRLTRAERNAWYDEFTRRGQQVQRVQESDGNTFIWFANCNPDLSRHDPITPDLSESVASGEIQSTGESVSVEDVIARIDKELEGNDP